MIMEMAEDSFAPLSLAAGLSVLFVGLLVRNWMVVGAGAAVVFISLVMWMWPRRDLREREAAHV